MSTIISFFAAPGDTAAAAVTDSGPEATFTTATYGNFAVWDAIDEWESLLTGRGLDDLIENRTVDWIGAGDRTPILVFPAPLTTALAGADADLLRDIAGQWIESEPIDEELAQEMLSEVATLAAEAERTGGGLYCWIS